MSAHYDFSVEFDVPENAPGLADLMLRIGRLVPPAYETVLAPSAERPGCVNVSVVGEGVFQAGTVLDFDRLIKKLGELAVAPTTARYVYEYDEPGRYYVGPESMRVAYTSARALARIRKMVDRLTPEDVATLRDELAARPAV